MSNIITTYFPSTLVYKRDDDALPTLSTTDGDSYTTPAISVPPNNNNPYILREKNPNGTVFIAVGAIVGAILIAFVLYHLVRSIKASSLAKRTLQSDKQMYEKYQNNNNSAYGNGLAPNSPSLYMNTEYQSSVAKLPLLSHHPSKSVLSGLNNNGSQVGDTSTIYASETGAATSKHDLTKLFISPTAEAMTHKKARASYYGGNANAGASVTNLSLLGNSTTNLANPPAASNRHSQLIPSLYVNNEINNSDYTLSTNANGAGSTMASPTHQPRSNRKTIPSMYLDDLIDDDK